MFSKITEAMWWYLTSRSQRAVIIITYGKAEGQPRGLDSQGLVEPVSNTWGPYGKNRQQPAMTVLNPPRRQGWTTRRWGCLLQNFHDDFLCSWTWVIFQIWYTLIEAETETLKNAPCDTLVRISCNDSVSPSAKDSTDIYSGDATGERGLLLYFKHY